MSQIFPLAPKLAWIHSRSAGVDSALFPALIEADNVSLTNARCGVRDGETNESSYVCCAWCAVVRIVPLAFLSLLQQITPLLHESIRYDTTVEKAGNGWQRNS